MGFLDRLAHGFNAFMNKDPTKDYKDYGVSYAYRPDRPRLSRGNERSIVTAIYNRIALDVSSITIKHCKLDDNGRYLSDVNSALNNCLNLEANMDQTGRAFIHDAVMSMLDEGVVALVPIDTDLNPENTGSYDILSIRTAKIIEWYPAHVKVRVYNDRIGEREDIIVSKKNVAIVENPLYAVINEPNSTMQRLIRKLNLLDIVDEQTSAGKLDLIIQLPYVIKSEARRQQADSRRKDIEMQLSGSKYGIAYTDGTERITQLNRPVENNLLKQIEYLTSMLYSQLSFHQTILDGTADEKTMLNYNNRIVEPIVSAFVDEMKRKFLTKTARTQQQTILFFRDPFKLVPINDIAEIADKFTRNEIMTSNEIRQIVGMKPSNDPKADRLVNSNLNHPEDQMIMENNNQEEYSGEEYQGMTQEEYDQAMAELDAVDDEIADLENSLPENDSLKHYASPYYDPVKAHEYYMRTRELKGTNGKTLNDEGKAAVRYVKEQLNTERKNKVAESKAAMKSKIDATNASTSEQLKNKRASMQQEIASRSKNLENDLKARKEDMQNQIESHKDQSSKKIESLRKQLDGMSMEDWNKNAERIMSEINSLKESNETIRAKLQAEYSEYSEKSRTSNKMENSKSRDKFNTESESLRESNKASNEDARKSHKEETAKLKEEYDTKYQSELEKIKSDSKFLKPTKKKSRKKS